MCYFSVSLANLCSCMLKAKWKKVLHRGLISCARGLPHSQKIWRAMACQVEGGFGFNLGLYRKIPQNYLFFTLVLTLPSGKGFTMIEKLNKQNSPPPPQTSDHLHFFILHLPGLWWRQIHLHGFLHTKKLPHLLFWNQVKLLSFCPLFKLECFCWYMCLF